MSNTATAPEIKKASRLEMAMQLVITDAIAKGHTDKNELIAYMQSETFEAAVKRYLTMLETI